jgi:type IV pilus assembly protein PilC
MSLITTPKELNQRAELYHQLGIMIAAGLSVQQSLEHLRTNPPSAALRQPISRWLEELAQGRTVSESVSHIGKWIPSFDIALIDASERSGRLDACFKLLAVYYRERAQMARQMISDMLYPLFIFNFAILIFPLIDLVTKGNLPRFLCLTVGIAVPLYALVFLVIYACQGRHGEAWRSRVENVLGRVPILRTARQDLALARLSAALESLLNAGVPIITAWELAAAASGSPALNRTVHAWRPALEEGSTFSELVTKSNQFPELFANLYHTGEVSGATDDTLTRLHGLYQSEGLRRMKALSLWTPKIIYFIILLLVAWKIVAWYAGSAAEVNQAIDFR